MEDLLRRNRITGRARLGSKTPGLWSANAVTPEWGAILASLALYGAPKLNTMYFEFENVSNPGTAVATPTEIEAGSQGVSYYQGLASSSTKDYVRALAFPESIDSTDPDLYPNGNRFRIFSVARGGQGVHGKPFAAASNSKVYGLALVAAQDPEDPSLDLVFSRWYAPAAEQLVKEINAQLTGEWEVAAV